MRSPLSLLPPSWRVNRWWKIDSLRWPVHADPRSTELKIGTKPYPGQRYWLIDGFAIVSVFGFGWIKGYQLEQVDGQLRRVEPLKIVRHLGRVDLVAKVQKPAPLRLSAPAFFPQCSHDYDPKAING
jgi:hypothetical protein